MRTFSLLLGQGGDELAAEIGDVGDDAAPDQVKGGVQASRTCIRGPSRGMQLGSPFLTGVLMGVVRTVRGGHGPGDRLTLAASSGPSSREECEKTPKSSCCLTKCKDNRRVVVVTVVLAHRTDLPVGVKTHPGYVRTDRLAEPSVDS